MLREKGGERERERECVRAETKQWEMEALSSWHRAQVGPAQTARLPEAAKRQEMAPPSTFFVFTYVGGGGGVDKQSPTLKYAIC